MPAKPIDKGPPKQRNPQPNPPPTPQPWMAKSAARCKPGASAWSRKDVKAYLAFYAPDFQTPNGMPRKAWEVERQRRIEKPGKISVSVSDIKVSVNGDRATVKFRQDYKSASLNSSAGKTLVMIRVGDKWLIQQERVG
jgi:murein L,D-transpeptidase YafK